MMARSVGRQEFKDALADCAASPAFREVYARFVSYDKLLDMDAMIHDGDLKVQGSFKVPALCTLITGNLTVDDAIDLQNKNFDGGGLFIVIGNVTCRHFISEYEANSFIDGDLEARDSIINGFTDSSLNVIGTLRTRLFIGCDIWATVGGGAIMEYGEGYCLPIDTSDAAGEAIRPQHDEDATVKRVTLPPKAEGYLFDAYEFAQLIRAGKPIFK
jgi:hypothetical protein